MKYDSTKDTLDHIRNVRRKLIRVAEITISRGMRHDASKLEEPEKSVFDIATPKLKELTVGTPAYEESREQLGEALQHHYEHNRHRPEHFVNGYRDMNLLDLIEMLCDWKAANERHGRDDFANSLSAMRERFSIDTEVYQILYQTAIDLGFLPKR